MNQRAALGIICLATVVISSLHGQESDIATRLRLAQSFEQSGDWEHAVTIYEEMYNRDKSSYPVFDGLRRAYTQLKRYNEAIGLVEQRLNIQPRDPLLLSVLAGLYYDAGSEPKADSLWRSVVNTDRRNSGLYRLVASQMLEHRLYEMAIQMYLAGRKEGLGDDAFSEELGSIYSALQQYGAATTEFVRILKKTPDQLPYIESRVASFTMRNDGLRAATGVVQAEVQRASYNIALRMFLAWLAMEGRDFEAAYTEYHAIDSLKKAKGSELFNFAQRAFQEKAYRVSAKAFHEIIENYPTAANILPLARFGYARGIEELSAESDTGATHISEVTAKETATWPVSESQPSFQGTIALYGRIIAEYPNSDLAAQAQYRIGLLRQDRFFDLDGALTGFESSRSSAKSQSLQFDAALKIAEVLIEQGKLDMARVVYPPLIASQLTGYQDRALFAMAELDYFEGTFDSSLSLLGRLTSNVSTDLANDALQLQYFIQENKSNKELLRNFSKADLLLRQRKYSEALARFKELVALNPNTLLVDDGMMRIGELQLTLRQTADALLTFQKITEMQSSILRDRAQLRLGEIFQNVLKDRGKAIEAYETILTKFPNSMYAEEARKRIRLLRGDAL